MNKAKIKYLKFIKLAFVFTYLYNLNLGCDVHFLFMSKLLHFQQDNFQLRNIINLVFFLDFQEAHLYES